MCYFEKDAKGSHIDSATGWLEFNVTIPNQNVKCINRLKKKKKKENKTVVESTESYAEGK